MRDLFSGAPINGHAYLSQNQFRWIVAIFLADGAVDTIKRANANELKTYYPVKQNAKGEYTPLFRNYLFVEFREYVTLDICRATSKFLKVLSAHDEEGILRPILVRRNAVDENKAMVLAGRFNERINNRHFYGKGHIVQVIEGTFIDKKVKLEIDVLPEMKGSTKIKIDINGVKAVIELYKLAL